MKTVLVTGATSGIGAHIVHGALKRGHKVIATGRGIDRVKEALGDKQNHPMLTVLDLDIANANSRSHVAAWLKQNLPNGRLDVLINNAGYGQFGPLELTTEEDLRRQFEVNFFGLALFTKDTLPFLRSSHGRILNISSTFGFLGFPMTGIYCASKFAVEGLSESLALELAAHNVQICLVEPGSVKTSFGKNIQMTQAPATSPYYPDLVAFKGFREKLIKKPGTSSEAAATKILNVMERAKMPLRVRIGNDAISAWFAHKWLPSAVFFAMQKAMTKMLGAKGQTAKNNSQMLKSPT